MSKNAETLNKLLPQGKIWNNNPTLNNLNKAFAHNFDAVEENAKKIPKEINPATSSTLINEWLNKVTQEENDTLKTDKEKRAYILSKVRARGGCSKEYFENLGKALGYENIQIEEPEISRAGIRTGQRIYSDDWAYVWIVDTKGQLIRYLRSQLARANNRLRNFDNGIILQDIYKTLEPAHTLTVYYS